MSTLKVYIKFFIFENIFSEIEKIVIIFSIFKIFFLKIKIDVCPKAHVGPENLRSRSTLHSGPKI